MLLLRRSPSLSFFSPTTSESVGQSWMFCGEQTEVGVSPPPPKVWLIEHFIVFTTRGCSGCSGVQGWIQFLVDESVTFLDESVEDGVEKVHDVKRVRALYFP